MPVAHCTRLSYRRGGPMPRRVKGPKSRTTFHALCDDVVLQIFALLPSSQRTHVLPLVCTRFARLVDSSNIDEVRLVTSRWGYGPSGNVLPWLHKRLPHLRRVEMVDYMTPVAGGCEWIVQQTPGRTAIVSCVLCTLSAAPLLTNLRVDLGAVDIHSLTALQACSSLQHLSVGVLRGCISTYHVEVVLRRLTALTTLQLEMGPSLHVTSTNLSRSVQCCRLPPSLFQLKLLQQMSIKADFHIINFGDVPKELGNLSSLRSLELYGCGVDSLPREVTLLQSLTTLVIENCECQQVIAESRWFNKDSMPQLRDVRLWPRFGGGFPFINWLNA